MIILIDVETGHEIVLDGEFEDDDAEVLMWEFPALKVSRDGQMQLFGFGEVDHD